MMDRDPRQPNESFDPATNSDEHADDDGANKSPHPQHVDDVWTPDQAERAKPPGSGAPPRKP